MKLGSLAVRGVVGPLFVGHGAQKLFGKFGGHGPEGTGQFFETLGLKPGRRHATAAGWTELAGGALLALGALTPLATSMISGTMITAMRKAHLKNGPWVTDGGYEYNLVLVAAMTALADAGPGKPSVDAALFPRLKGPAWAALGLAAAGAASALVTSGRLNEAAAPAPPEACSPVAGDPVVAEEPRFTREPSGAPVTGA